MMRFPPIAAPFVLLAACGGPSGEVVGFGSLGGNACDLDKYGPELEYLYVMNRGSDSVTVVNPRSCTSFKDIAVGADPVMANATASGAHVYVVNQGDDTVSIIDTEDNVYVDTLPVGGTPDWIRFDIPHLFLWTTAQSGQLSLIDVIERDVVDTLTIDEGPHCVGMSKLEPFKAYVTSHDTDTVQVFDSETRADLGTIDLADGPTDLAYSTLSEQMYVCTRGESPGIDVIPVAGDDADTVVQHIDLDVPCEGVVFDPTGQYGFLLRRQGTTLTVLDASTDTVHAEIAVGEAPDRVAFHDDVALVSNLLSADLSLIDLATFEEVERVSVGDPSQVQLPARDRQLRRSLGDPDVFYLVNPYDGTLTLYDAVERQIRGTVDVGIDPGDVMIAGPIGGSCC